MGYPARSRHDEATRAIFDRELSDEQKWDVRAVQKYGRTRYLRAQPEWPGETWECLDGR